MLDRLLRERLPDWWSIGVTDDGRVFFIDDGNQRTTWLHPSLGIPVQTGHLKHESLPDGWEMEFELFGRPFYIDHRNQNTTYTHPRSLGLPDSGTYSPIGNMRPQVRDEIPNNVAVKRAGFGRSSSRKKSVDKAPSARRDFETSIVKGGWLYRQESGIMKPWRQRYCILTDYCLFLYEDETQSKEVGSVVLAGYWITPCIKSDRISRKFAFTIDHKNTKPIYMAAESEEEMNEWLSELTKAAAVPELFQRPNHTVLQDELGNKENMYPLDAGSPQSVHPYASSSNAQFNNPRQLDDYNQAENQYNRNHSKQNEFNGYRSGDYGLVLRQKPGIDVDPQHQQRLENFPQENSFFPGQMEPSATSTPAINMNQFDWSSAKNPQNFLPQYSTVLREGPNATGSRLSGVSIQEANWREGSNGAVDGRYLDRSLPLELGGFHDQIQARGDFGVPHDAWRSSAEQSYISAQNEKPVTVGNTKLSNSQSSIQAGDFPVAGRHSSLRTSQELALYNENPASRYLNPQYLHEPNGVRDQQSRDLVNSSADAMYRHSWAQNPNRFQPQRMNVEQNMMQAKPNSMEVDYSPSRPPIPTVLRDKYIDELAEMKTPLSRQDILQAKEISQRRLNEPQFFQFPETMPQTQVKEGTGSNRINVYHQAPNNPQAYFRQEPLSSSLISGAVGDEFEVNPASTSDRRSPTVKLDRMQQENRISKSMDELRQLNQNSEGISHEQADGLLDNSRSNYDSSHSAPYAPVSPGMNRKVILPSRGIEPIKEDPDMSDTDVLNTRTLQDMQKMMLGHTRLRLSISVQDLVGKSQEELVLLLIQLRRSQAKLEQLLNWARNRLNNAKPQENAYKRERKNSVGRLEDSLEYGHAYFVELQRQADELEKQIEVTQPLINLLDNIVTMGSLYNGNSLMYASQYKQSQLQPDQVIPPKTLLEFSRRNQEERLASKQEQSLRQLTEDEVNLEEKLQQLYALDSLLQEHSFNVTSLQEDKLMLEKMLSDLSKAEKSEINVVMLERLGQQRQVCEKQLTAVRQNLAETSKILEETSIENARVEQQVVLLRNKVHGGLVRSQSTPSLAGGSVREIVKLEEELKQIKAVMDGLASQGTKLSEAMQNLKSPESSRKVSVGTPSKAGYLETDLDTKISRDIAVHDINENRSFGLWAYSSTSTINSRGHLNDSYASGHNLLANNPQGQNNGARFEYRYVTPPSGTRPGNQYDRQPENHFQNQLLSPQNGYPRNQYDSQTMGQYGQNNSHMGNKYGSQPALQFGNVQQLKGQPGLQTGVSFHGSNSGPVISNSVSSSDERLARGHMHPASVREFKKRELLRRNPSEMLFDDDSRYSVLQRTRSLPRFNSNSLSRNDFGRQSSDNLARKKSTYYLPPSGPNVVHKGADAAEVQNFDDSTIDKALFQRPELVEIPERYVPDSSDDDESQTMEERLRRSQKSDQIKKMLAKQSLQEFTQGELTLQSGPVHQQIDDETRRREQILDVKRSLAKEVMIKSKEDAALRRRTWGSTDADYVPNGFSN